MSNMKPSLPTEAETVGWRLVRRIGDPDARSVSWERGCAQIHWTATGHSSNDYRRPTFTTKPFIAFTQNKGALTSEAGRLRVFSSFQAAAAAIEGDMGELPPPECQTTPATVIT